MSPKPSSSWKGALIFSYLAVLAVGVYFSWGAEAFRPRYLLLAAAAGIGLGLGFLLTKVFAKEGGGNRLVPMVLFAAIQGGLVGALAHFIFRIPWLPALAFPAGALVGLAAWWALDSGFRPLVGALVGWGIPEEHATEYETGVREGGIVLGIECASEADARAIEADWRTAGAVRITERSVR